MRKRNTSLANSSDADGVLVPPLFDGALAVPLAGAPVWLELEPFWGTAPAALVVVVALGIEASLLAAEAALPLAPPAAALVPLAFESVALLAALADCVGAPNRVGWPLCACHLSQSSNKLMPNTTHNIVR